MYTLLYADLCILPGGKSIALYVSSVFGLLRLAIDMTTLRKNASTPAVANMSKKEARSVSALHAVAKPNSCLTHMHACMPYMVAPRRTSQHRDHDPAGLRLALLTCT